MSTFPSPSHLGCPVEERRVDGVRHPLPSYEEHCCHKGWDSVDIRYELFEQQIQQKRSFGFQLLQWGEKKNKKIMTHPQPAITRKPGATFSSPPLFINTRESAIRPKSKQHGLYGERIIARLRTIHIKNKNKRITVC